MVRDYSAFLSDAAPRYREPTALERLGRGLAYARQIDADALTATLPVRVVAVHRSGLQMAGDGIDETIPPRPDSTVGDWLLYECARPRSSRVLKRKSLIKRRTPGTAREVQLTDAAAGIAQVFEDIKALAQAAGRGPSTRPALRNAARRTAPSASWCAARLRRNRTDSFLRQHRTRRVSPPGPRGRPRSLSYEDSGF